MTEGTTVLGAAPAPQAIALTSPYWSYQAAPGRRAGKFAAKDVEFGAET